MASSAVDTVTDPIALVRAEREKRRLAKAKVMAEADALYTAWYQDVGTRVELKTRGEAGIHFGRVMTFLPRCWCGKASKALGMCTTHYSQWFRRITGVYNGRRNQIALCHPDRPHHGLGLCRECHDNLPITKARQRLSNRRSDFLTAPQRHVPLDGLPATLCGHHDRKMYGRGLCNACYQKAQREGRLHLYPKVRKPKKHCRFHKDRPVVARGLCKPCYQTWWYRHAGKRKGVKRFRRQGDTTVVCGHDGPHDSHDLCRRCTAKARYKRWRKDHPLTRLPPGLGVLCGHFDRKLHGKGCCRACYNKKVWQQPEYAARLMAVIQRHQSAYTGPPVKVDDVRPDVPMLDSVIA